VRAGFGGGGEERRAFPGGDRPTGDAARARRAQWAWGAMQGGGAVLPHGSAPSPPPPPNPTITLPPNPRWSTWESRLAYYDRTYGKLMDEWYEDVINEGNLDMVGGRCLGWGVGKGQCLVSTAFGGGACRTAGGARQAAGAARGQ
jgi:hypothetical protein